MKVRIRSLCAAMIVGLWPALPVVGHGGGAEDHHGDVVFDPATAEQKPFGIAGDPKKTTRTITFDMVDAMRFYPSRISVKRGATVRFVVKNNGKLMHEIVLGRMQDLQEHADLMKKFPGMEHDESHMAHVAPGKTKEIVWTFNRPGQFNYACLIAGHFEAGMMGSITVN